MGLFDFLRIVVLKFSNGGAASLSRRTAKLRAWPANLAINGERRMSQVTPIVFVVDDDISVRESLGPLIRCEGWHPETFASAQEFLDRPRSAVPSCLILDVSLPGLNGLELQERLASADTYMPIIFITGHGDVPMTVRAMKAGAVEFLTKPFSDDVLLNAVRAAIERSRVALGQDAEMRALRDCYASLSKRERQVMALVVTGLLNKQVAGELGISEITVKAHRGKVMQKMKAGSFADLVKMDARLRPAHAALTPALRPHSLS
jgi:FixJ family two-component response regulator